MSVKRKAKPGRQNVHKEKVVTPIAEPVKPIAPPRKIPPTRKGK